MATQIYTVVPGKAGKYVAGIRLDPGQTTIELTPEQAAYEIAQGTITATGQPGSAVPPAAPVAKTDIVQLLRGGLPTRPTVEQLAAFVQATAQRINHYDADTMLSAEDKGALVIIANAAAGVVTLPADWAPGESVTIRRGGAGAVTWALAGAATIALPTAKSTHTGISAQHEEAVFKVLSNAGDAAVWGVAGATA
ncbi:MAG: hypothetical protein QHC89_01855 [Bosea sp. (in: a-proteobacteria)]|nr:hypothetical protein [Bosea sp. (in: a-proteobacteria)]